MSGTYYKYNVVLRGEEEFNGSIISWCHLQCFFVTDLVVVLVVVLVIIRRLVVALSRARLGLYVFGRRALFERCSELAPAFKLLLSRPTQLLLMGAETYPTNRPVPPSNNSNTGTGTGTGNKAQTGAGSGQGSASGVDHGQRDRELSVEGPTDMGVLVYQMAQQQTQLK